MGWILENAWAGIWFLVGWEWCKALRAWPRASVIGLPYPVEHVPEDLAPMIDKMGDTVKRARMLGPGMMAYFSMNVDLDGAVVTVAVQCLGQQFAPACEIEKRR